ncbi:uncharacterized protein Dwil_GK13662 [Drosophila willistoni]|uniref:Fork-head domain-containing protein n=1 Tax=Drosophila willistoni TaxID=7260 RepID=B4NHI0_DROWI|nr:uncharacterized protein LOC6651490 [Drosophila willistoni]EDW83549.1 uncharacterized protein Dwil_GK13662 [Drosophila willistoni]
MAHTDLSTSRTSSPDQEQSMTHPLKLMSGIYPNSSVVPRHAQSTSMALEQYRLQLYNLLSPRHMERLRTPQYTATGASAIGVPPWMHLNPHLNPYSPHNPGTNVNANRMAALSTISLFPQSQRIFQPEEPKPQHSYIGLIAMAILSSSEMKLVLSDIYQYILDNYPYFRSRGPGWRNSIRHNLSLNDCFIKSGRSANGKGHYWAIHPANIDDFRKGDFRRRKAQRKVRKHMGLSVDDATTDSPSPPPLDLSTPPPPTPSQASLQLAALSYPYHQHQHYIGQFFGRNISLPPYRQYSDVHHERQRANLPRSEPVMANPQNLESEGQQAQQQDLEQAHHHIAYINSTTTTTIANLYSQTRKRQFDVASLLAPDVQLDIVSANRVESPGTATATATRTTTQTQHTVITKVQVQKQQTIHHEVLVGLEQPVVNMDGADPDIDDDVDVDVVDNASDCEAKDPTDADSVRKTPHKVRRIQQIFSSDDNNSYLSDARRSSLDVDPEDNHGPRLFPVSVSPVLADSAARSLASSCSPHDSNSFEESPIDVAASTESVPVLPNTTHPLATSPKGYVELNHVDPHILSRYYGTYMAAAARRASLEASRSKSSSITPPPPIEFVAHKS